MQLSGNITNLHGTKSPPAPMVQTSVSANHSRNVSQSSGTSNNDVQQLSLTVALPSSSSAIPQTVLPGAAAIAANSTIVQ